MYDESDESREQDQDNREYLETQHQLNEQWEIIENE